MNIKKYYSYKKIFLLLILYSIVLISSMLTTNINSIKLLPIIFSIGVTLLFLFKKDMNLIYKIIIFLFSIRMFFYPILCLIYGMSFEGYNFLIQNNIILSSFIQCYEFMLIVLFLLIYKNNREYNEEINIEDDISLNHKLLNCLKLLIILSIFIILIYPSILWKFKPIVFLNEVKELEWNRNANNVKNLIPGYTYNLALWLLLIIRILIVYLSIILLKRRSKKSNESIFIILSFLIILTLIIVSPDDKANSFFAVISFSAMLCKLYPDKKKNIMKISMLFILISVISILFIIPIIKQGEIDMLFLNIRNRLNAYFGGTLNISAIFEMKRENLVNYFIVDILRSIPLVMSFFSDIDTSNILFNSYLGKDIIYNSQILPNIGQGYFYFGFFLSPILSIMLLWKSLNNYNKAINLKNSFEYFINFYSAILCVLGIVLYNFTLTLNLFLQYIAPLYLIYILFIKYEKNKKQKIIK